LRVVLSDRAQSRLNELYEYLWREASESIAEYVLEDILQRIESLARFPNRGAPRDYLGRPIRTLSDRFAVIAYSVAGGTVTVIDIFVRGQDYSPGFYEEYAADWAVDEVPTWARGQRV
jgi:plasmid stabilization system protein ParE